MVLAEMETHGILLRPGGAAAAGRGPAERVEELRDEILEIAGVEFNPDSPKQLAEVLFDRLGLHAGQEDQDRLLHRHEVLDKLAAEEDRGDPRTSVPRLILDYRQLTKLISTYLGTLRESVNPRPGGSTPPSTSW